MQHNPSVNPSLQGGPAVDFAPLMEIPGLGNTRAGSNGSSNGYHTEQSPNEHSRRDYKELSLQQLKDELILRGLKRSGKKETLRTRLVEDDDKKYGSQQRTSPSASAGPTGSRSPHPSQPTPQSSARAPVSPSNNEPDLLCSFDRAVSGSLDDKDFEEDEGEVNDESEAAQPLAPADVADKINKQLSFCPEIQWVDHYILDAHRQGGKKTETSVLRHWRVWLIDGIQQRIIPDAIVDAEHIIQYLKYAATRKLFSRNGKEKETGDRLSSNSLRKITVMLGRVRRRQVDADPSLDQTRPASSNRLQDFTKAVMIQANRLRLEREDFDVTKGTLLEYELRPEQLDEVTTAIFGLNQINSTVKTLFAWNWQAATLIRGDELVNLWLSCVQPYEMAIPDTRFSSGSVSASNRKVRGILSLYYDGKTARTDRKEPNYNMVIPHRDPLRCPVAATALILHFIFDQEGLVSRVEGWDWTKASTWRSFHLLFGKKVEQSLTNDGLSRMYSKVLDKTSVSHSKKAHLCRKTVPAMIEDMGVTADQVDAVGHWEGNTRREVYAGKIPKMAVLALAGFGVGETYVVPWSEVPVPEALCNKIFPFAETALAQLRAASSKNQGSINFLELLIFLRPFFWKIIAVADTRFPECNLLKRLNVVQCEEAQEFFREWPTLLSVAESQHHQTLELSRTFSEMPTQNAFLSLSTSVRNFEDHVQREFAVLHRRTAQLSPSKKRPACEMSFEGHGSKRARLESPPSPLNAMMMPVVPRASSPYCPPTAAGQFEMSTIIPAPALPAIPTTSITHLTPPPPFIPSQPPLPSLSCLVPVYETNASLYILPLTPPQQGSPPFHTAHDKILPSPAAFADLKAPAASWPDFSTSNCSWSYIFNQVKQPVKLWDVYAPSTLGKYQTVRDLWTAWDEGSRIDDVGCMPPLRLIEQKWGKKKNETTRKGHQAQWRPSNENNARKIWSNYWFFIQRIQEYIADGRTPDEAIEELEKLRGTLSLTKLMQKFQVPRKKANQVQSMDNAT